MKYTIRFRPDVPGIESAHWAVWRPGSGDKKPRDWHVCGTALTLEGAYKIVQRDIADAREAFAKSYLHVTDLWHQSSDPTPIVYWWAGMRRNDWRERFFRRN